MKVRLKPVDRQTIVITGASSGIGLATALEAARRGARLVLNSRDEEDLASACAQVRDLEGRVAAVVGDVADPATMRRLHDVAHGEFGGFDSWVNNAGVSIYGRIEDVSLDDARRLFETNYWGVVNGSLVAVPHLRARGGALVNVGSVLSETTMPLQGHYSASKHAVKGFTDALRIELEKEGAPVSVTLIQPAAIDTPYPEHAMNYLATEPTHEPPVYAPEVVADAILECCERPHRNLRVGGAAKMFTVMEKLAPGLADRKKLSSIDAQHSDRPAQDDDTLWAPRPGDGRVHGSYDGHVMKSSAYTAMAKRPMTTLGVAALAVGLGLAAGRLLDRGD